MLSRRNLLTALWTSLSGASLAARGQVLQAQSGQLEVGGAATHPLFLATPAWDAIRARMKKDYEANSSRPATLGGRIYKTAKTLADEKLGANSYKNYGMEAAFMAMVNKDARYAAKALEQINRPDGFFATTYLNSPFAGVGWFNRGNTTNENDLGQSFCREFGVDVVLMYDWLYPYLSTADRDKWLAQLNHMFTYMVNTDPASQRLMDSDQVTGTYFGLAMYYYGCRGDSRTPATLWANRIHGGSVATGANFLTKRNAIKWLIENACRGGEWCESSEYNTGTTRLMVQGLSALSTTPAAADFATEYAYLKDVALRQAYQVTPDFLDQVQWGDEENPHTFFKSAGEHRMWDWSTANLCLLGVLADGDSERQTLLRRQLDLEATHPSLWNYAGSTGMAPWGKGVVFGNPYGTALSAMTSARKGFFAEGQGMTIYHDGFGAADAMFYTHAREDGFYVDHQIVATDFGLYRRGSWALTHPFGYGSTLGVDGNLVAGTYNSLTVESFGGRPRLHIGNPDPMSAPALQFRKNVAQHFGSDYAYLCHVQGGEMLPGTYEPPPVFLHEWARQPICLFSADKSSVVIVVFDRINADDPQALERFDRYTAQERADIARDPRWQWYLHALTEPMFIRTDIATWTSGANEMALQWLSPPIDAVTLAKEDERTISPYGVFPTEKKWRLKVTPDANQKWNTLLAAIVAKDKGETVTATLITGTANSIGAHVAMSGNDDRIIIFYGGQGKDLPAHPTAAQCASVLQTGWMRTTSFDGFSWSQTTASAKVIITSLNPANTWSFTIDGGSRTPLAVNSDGIAEITVTTAARHTLAVTAA